MVRKDYFYMLSCHSVKAVRLEQIRLFAYKRMPQGKDWRSPMPNAATNQNSPR